MMKKILFILFSVISTATIAQGIKMPAPSPGQSIKQDFSLSSVEVKYSRPVIKGRKIFGDVVPFGKLWRTGANSPTTVTFNEDVKIAGQALKAGTYQLISIPSQFSWEIIFNKGTNGVFNYKPEEDVLKVKIAVSVLSQSVESFTIHFANVISNKMEMVISWEKVAVSIPIETEVDSKITASIDKAMAADTRPYFESASYYFETGKDLKKALEWVTKAVENNPSAYWIWHLQAKIQAKLGDKVGAKASAEKSIALAKEGKNEDYVTLNLKLIQSL
jgi:tetratricopeptide (TPR) repeat protein